jgi:hypothetical protein
MKFILNYLFWTLIRRKRYVSKLLMVNASVWWDREGESIASFQRITKSTAIGLINKQSAKIYFPVDPHGEIVGGVPMYRAKVAAHSLMMQQELNNWIDKVQKHPFI